MNSTSDRLAALKQKLAAQRTVESKPFPAWALIALYIRSHKKDTYCDHFYGFRILQDWLHPIELPAHTEPLLPLQGSYEIQEIARMLGTSQDHINHAIHTACNITELTKYYDYRHKDSIAKLF